MCHNSLIGILLVLSCLWPGIARAGTIFLPGRLSDGKFVANQEAKTPCYAVQYGAITAAVDGDAASVTLQETIAAPEKVIDSVCVIPLPEGVDGRGAVVSAGIPNGDRAVLPAARFLGPAEAQKLYEAVSRATDSTKILAFSGRPALLVPEFRLQGKVEVTVEFRQRIRRQDGLRSLECPTPKIAFASGPVARLSASVTLSSDEPLRAVLSPTHAVTVDRAGLHKATARVKCDNWSGTDDLRLLWAADRDDLGLRVLACRPDAGEDGYFMLVGNPTGSHASERAAEKDVIFVLDTSGSMRGEKIEQARAAIDYCLGQLNPGDRFNIVTFGTEVAGFRDALVARSPSELAAAREFVDSLVAKGQTNLGGALAKALAGEPGAERPRIVIFLTDGTPTAGELVPEKILAHARQANTSAARVFVVGLGHDVNAHLLDKLAEMTDGSSEYAVPGEEIDAKVATLYDRLAHPVLTDVAVKFGELPTNSVYPQKLPALFRGSEVTVLGRYRKGGKHTFTVSGKRGGQPVEYACAAELPEKPAENGNGFVASLWAARKIGYLLQEVRLHGANDELIAEIVRLSKRFGIVTEYTEFLATATADMTSGAAVEAARQRMKEAASQQAGQWAVNQAFNDRQLQQRAVASQTANNYVDRRGNLVSLENNVRQMGRRVFYLRDGQWVDGEDAGKRKTRVVKLHGEEYRELVRSQRDFAQAQQLGWAVSMNVGDERIVVEKEGKQKDEELRRQAVQQVEEQQIPVPMNQMQQQFRNQLPLLQNNLPDQQLRQLVPRREIQEQKKAGDKQP